MLALPPCNVGTFRGKMTGTFFLLSIVVNVYSKYVHTGFIISFLLIAQNFIEQFCFSKGTNFIFLKCLNLWKISRQLPPDSLIGIFSQIPQTRNFQWNYLAFTNFWPRAFEHSNIRAFEHSCDRREILSPTPPWKVQPTLHLPSTCASGIFLSRIFNFQKIISSKM